MKDKKTNELEQGRVKTQDVQNGNGQNTITSREEDMQV